MYWATKHNYNYCNRRWWKCWCILWLGAEAIRVEGGKQSWSMDEITTHKSLTQKYLEMVLWPTTQQVATMDTVTCCWHQLKQIRCIYTVAPDCSVITLKPYYDVYETRFNDGGESSNQFWITGVHGMNQAVEPTIPDVNGLLARTSLCICHKTSDW